MRAARALRRHGRPFPQGSQAHGRQGQNLLLTGKLYEAPGDLVGKQVRLLYHEHDPARIEYALEIRPTGSIGDRHERELPGQEGERHHGD